MDPGRLKFLNISKLWMNFALIFTEPNVDRTERKVTIYLHFNFRIDQDPGLDLGRPIRSKGLAEVCALRMLS